ncbi:MAG: FkbM family methyltransferase [Nitrososphaerota archaeon]|jgi:hypothetical protein|uniref:FkbM family methyltransferase n=1 Tax=Candidatus Bathycorpusculum sp. TaxID=2994959 RepID=UPI0028243D3D|nr:FkbM family methyltransferase [Candidatus Termitimicrobium sp.]MCL2432145.1 FkbM family methyltransferase [Candidatus Termitimicrobium sp.]MDR0492285.1 FkbM family methyltransferase [Nitrososphaerota archaeon]
MTNITVKKMYYKFAPFGVREKIERFRRRKEIDFFKTCFEQQETYFRDHLDEFRYDDAKKTDILRVFSLLKEKGPVTFPEMNELIRKKYFTRKLEIKKDSATGLFYVLVDNNKKLFYKSGMDEISVYRSFNSVSLEQDYASPHRYLTNDQYFVGVMNSDAKQVSDRDEDSFGVTNNGIIIDVGAAEGNFALSVIEQASKVYIIESDAAWCEALKHTFSPYKEKVEIIQKYLSNISDDNHITLNDLIKEYNIDKVNFLKMDIEGYEKQALHGGTIEDNAGFVNIDKMAICTYHNPEDDFEISNFVSQYGYNIYLTKGYIFFPDSNNPPIRKAVLRAYR